MPVGRYFRGLNSYDLLGNLLPGIVAFVVTLGAFASPPIPGNVGEYGLFAIGAFLVGGLIQSFASTAVGSRKHFDWTMSRAEERSISELAEAEDPCSDEGSEKTGGRTVGSGNGPIWKLAHPFVGPLLWWLRPDRGEQLDDTILINRIWEYLVDTHEIPFRTTSYSVLYHVMSSRIDNIRSPSRATRMQALRNLYRGMWIASWYASVLLIAVFIADSVLIPGTDVPIVGLEYARPAIFQYWAATWTLLPIALAGVLFFWLQAESSEEDYIEYLFADYVVAVASQTENISFDEDSSLAITGEVTAGLLDQEPGGNEGDRGGTSDTPGVASRPDDADSDGDHGDRNTKAG